jgi:hypothetical protein
MVWYTIPSARLISSGRLAKRTMLLDMEDRDQAIRRLMGQAIPSKEQLQSMRDIDTAHIH